jgi:hypothetical protein
MNHRRKVPSNRAQQADPTFLWTSLGLPAHPLCVRDEH